jgi:glycerate-2-kinase
LERLNLIIKNKDELIQNGESPTDREARSLLLESLEFALKEINPYRLIKSQIKYNDEKLNIMDTYFNLNKFDNIFVIGGGKASGSMAQALEEILNNKITDGIVNVPKGTEKKYSTDIIKLHGSSHPIPSQNGVSGVERMMDLVKKANENDLIICLISGGGSALMPFPIDEVTLDEKQSITKKLLLAGANINELNAVRKHLSKFKGGWLAKKAHPATLIGLILSDVVGDPLDVIASGPTVPDTSRFKDAIFVLDKYDIWKDVSNSIKEYFKNGEKGFISDTPKPNESIFQKVQNFIIGNNRLACLKVEKKLKSMRVDTHFLTSFLEGESRHAGLFYSALVLENYSNRNNFSNPQAIIMGGETTVTVVGKGRGGRNQEAILSAATKICGLEGVAIASIGTDGIDGPTDAAGSIADGKSLLRAEEKDLSPYDSIRNNDSYNFFNRINDLIFTGLTGTNVNDIAAIIVMPNRD